MVKELERRKDGLLTKFIVRNFRGIEGEACLDLTSGQLNNDSMQVKEFEGVKISAASALIGSRPSKNTEIVDAFNAFLLDIIGYYRQGGNQQLLFNRKHEKTTSPTEFEVTFYLDGKEYRYGCYRTASVVLEEWLFEREYGKDAAHHEVCVFYRERDKFISDIKGESRNKLMSALKVTHPDQLSLCVLGKRSYNPYNFISHWFLDIAQLQYIPDKLSRWNTPSYTAMTLHRFPELKDFVLAVLRKYDGTISGLETIETKTEDGKPVYDIVLNYSTDPYEPDKCKEIPVSSSLSMVNEIITLAMQIELSHKMNLPILVKITHRNFDLAILKMLVNSYSNTVPARGGQLLFTLESDTSIKGGIVTPGLVYICSNEESDINFRKVE